MISFVNSTTGYLCSNSGGIYQTTDSGVNWIYQGSSPSTSSSQMISFVNSTTSSTFNSLKPNPNRKLEKVVDILGRETKPQPNTQFIEIYDNGSTEKRIVVE